MADQYNGCLDGKINGHYKLGNVKFVYDPF